MQMMMAVKATVKAMMDMTIKVMVTVKTMKRTAIQKKRMAVMKMGRIRQ